MILGDNDLRYYMELGKLIVSPIGEKTVRENGMDLSIGDEIGIEDEEYISTIDSHDSCDVGMRFDVRVSKDKDFFIIEPNSLNLLTTNEFVKLPDDLMAFCALRSSVARHGFIAPITIVDAGFEGTLTIEVHYCGRRPFKLYIGDRFLHVIFAKTNSPVKNTYEGIYKGQKGVRVPKVLD